MARIANDDALFDDAVQGLRRGDFSRLEPLFVGATDGTDPQVIVWHRHGRFQAAPDALAEALTCASFLGHTVVISYLLSHGVGPTAGDATGLDALHWAANRGQLAAVRLLLRHGAPLERRNRHGTTVLGTAVWSAINEPRGEQLSIIERLIDEGARLDAIRYPTGHQAVDAILRRHLAG